jgi:excisionase family DNA binding protein
MMAGVNPAAVQRILRHHDPRITTEIYGHLEPGYLRDEINSLKFGAALVSSDESREPAPAAKAAPLVTPLLQDERDWVWTHHLVPDDLLEIAGDLWARHRGFEPLTYGSGVGRPPLGARSKKSQVGGNIRTRTTGKIQRSHPLAAFSSPLVTPLLQGPTRLRVVEGRRDRLLSVRQVAQRLSVSTATVYALVTRGDLPHIRVANAIRVAPRALWTFMATQMEVATSASGRTRVRTQPAKDCPPSTEATSNEGDPRHE